MSLEEPKFSETEIFKVKMAIQIELIRRALPTGDKSTESKLDWITLNAPKFAELFEQRLAENPNLIDEYYENPTTVIQSFEPPLWAGNVREKAA